MKIQKIDRFLELKLRNGRILKNRVVVPPMASETADCLGFVTEKTFQHYRRLTQSGAGLIVVEYSFVHVSGRSEENQLGVSEDAHIEGLSLLANVIHSSGAAAGIQLTHSGGKTSPDLTGGAMMGPSDVPVPVKDRELLPTTPMSEEEVHLWESAFLQAAERAVKAGFDLIELHSAHGYGLNQWLSPLTNRRTDRFGGSLANRFRLLLGIIRAIRVAHPRILLAVRMPGQDFLEGGLSVQDSIQLAEALEKEGVDLIDVSSGIGGWRRPRERIGEGYLVPEAAQIQPQLSIPVIGVGGIQTGDFIDQALQRGMLSLAAVGRAILKDPLEWGQSWMNSPRSPA